MMVYLDTHVTLWLYAGLLELISEKALNAINENDLFISPVVELELQYLKETDRITRHASEITSSLRKEINLQVCAKNLHSIIEESFKHRWTRDPFDRIMVSHASLNKNILITKDDIIRGHYKKTLW